MKNHNTEGGKPPSFAKKQYPKARMSMSKFKDKIKKLGYKYYQEDDRYCVDIPGYSHTVEFHSQYHLCNWFHHYLALGLDKDE